jgi:phage-related tail fiber protein
MADTKTYGTIVTDVGVDLITQATMEGQKVNITQLAVGDGDGAYYQPTPDMTELKGEQWRGAVNSVAINEDSPNMIDVIAIVPSDVGGFTIREMCILDDANNMIAVCNTPDTEKVIISSGAAGEIELTMHIEISNTGSISFIIDPTVITATKKDLEDHNASSTAHNERFAQKASVTDFNGHANDTDIHVNPTTMGNYDTAIADLIAHTEDETIHTSESEKDVWNAAAQTAQTAADNAEQALNKTAELESRVARVEDGLFNNITANPFLVSFDSLSGIVLTKGIWNTARQRIEC